MPNFPEQPNFDLKVPSLPTYNIGWLHRLNEALQAVVNRTRWLYENAGDASVEFIDSLESTRIDAGLSANQGVVIYTILQQLGLLIESKADLESPIFSGTVRLPTAVQGTNDDEAASTQFVNDAIYNAINALISNAPEALNQLNELAAALNNDPNFATTILNAVATKLAFDVVQTLTLEQKNNVYETLGLKAGAFAEDSDDLSEGLTNLYFSESRVLGTILSALSFLDSSPVLATDNALVAFGKLQAQINAVNSPANQNYWIEDFDGHSSTFKMLFLSASATNISTSVVSDGNSVPLNQPFNGALYLKPTSTTFSGQVSTNASPSTQIQHHFFSNEVDISTRFMLLDNDTNTFVAEVGWGMWRTSFSSPDVGFYARVNYQASTIVFYTNNALVQANSPAFAFINYGITTNKFLKLRMRHTGTAIECYINNVLVHTFNANLPAKAHAFGFAFQNLTLASPSSNAGLVIDYVDKKVKFSTAR
ncbi:hypothetical protein [Agitococcus lubricus]|uniref:Uncharacterized protein n=1 Tax=Agitococcus lubricus TaxID=1077255 RepID=A0A2T5J3U8_9GAMM|nr:hypothetical protein [Agitococcus lubricus]PTQ91271.1 hypothetical protein C8N29_101344 [Agitococcus lubricus]